MIQNYINRYSLRDSLIKEDVPDNLAICVVIPSFAEGDISRTIKSLFKCERPYGISVEIILVINASENHSDKVAELNEITFKSTEPFKGEDISLHILKETELAAKKAGVGLARKIGMDEAARRLFVSKSNEKIIACFDADAECEPNYLTELYTFFFKHKSLDACSVYFEHPLDSKIFSKDILDGILHYEMHLRYYRNALKYAKSRYAFHTIGSSMAVRAEAYVSQGGMNQRKAGEDFYFLQKFMKIKKLGELNTSMIIPSPRASDRVPFGTGRAIQEHLDGEREVNLSYSFTSFQFLKKVFISLENWYDNEEMNEAIKVLADFLGDSVFNDNMNRIKKLSNSYKDFEKRFHEWFDAFTTLKFIHYLRDHHFPNETLNKEVGNLLNIKNIDARELLEELRRIDRS